MKTKTFDCVEMKNEIQAKRWREYQAHKDEYPSYAAFIQARAQKSEWASRVRGQVTSSLEAISENEE